MYEFGTGKTLYYCRSCEMWIDVTRNGVPDEDADDGCPHCGEEIFEEIQDEIPMHYYMTKGD